VGEFKNLYCVKSTSGKFHSEHMEEWLKEVVLKEVADPAEGAVLIVDEWTGFNSMLKMPEIRSHNIDVRRIPAGATSTEQVLDVYFNRQWKHYAMIQTERILHQRPDFKVSIRRNAALLKSLSHRQFSAPRFADAWKYGWKQAHYYTEHPPKWMTPAFYCFRGFELGSRCYLCKKLCFIRCGWCSNYLCFDHFITARHNCSGNNIYPELVKPQKPEPKYKRL
jgi:Tc5 transposase C-terminal domain/DDE superfamily endonuclease